MTRGEEIIAKTRIAWLAAAIALFGALALFGAARAQDPTPRPVTDNEVNAIASEMYCPVCENVPLDACGTPACAQWRGLIREKLSLGWNEQQIKDYFVAYYGDRVLAEPPLRGLHWLVYILPPLFFLAGAFVLYRVLRRMRAAPAQSAPDLPPQDDPYVSRFEEQVRRSE